ncbi:MAG TPA: hypothetical protein VGE99_11015 [Candidatus Dormibacteraeota bacterium]
MSKSITTRWYIGAWIVAVIAGIVAGVVGRNSPGTTPPAVTIAYLVAVACGIVMFVMWIGALIKLGQERSWGWFLFLLLIYLLTLGILGIVGMVAYAIAGPDDTTDVVMRPTVT